MKDDGTGDGLRYSLPAPFLVVTPKPDGTLETTVVMLPDPDATYTIRTRSVVSAYTLDVQLENQMLKSVSFNSKSDAVAAAAAESAGNLAADRIQTIQKAEEEAAKADADAAKALADAQVDVDTAQAKLTLIEEAVTNGKADEKELLAARIELEQAKVKRDALKRAQPAQRNTSANSAAANAPQQSRAAPDATAAGPMLFRIVPDGKGVKLVAVRGPTVFTTSAAATIAAPPGFSPAGTHTLRPDQSGDLKLELNYNRTVTRLVSAQLFKQTDPSTELANRRPTVTVAPDAAGAKFAITFDRATEAGDYILLLTFERTGGATDQPQVYVKIVR
ncbi:MAG TPA: hypothetical protein VIA98_10980 [Allosphingosinicella sp.]|jgi:hypothetical protein